MKSSEEAFLSALTKKAKQQARFEQTSPLPEWVRPFVSVIGLHYWQVLLLVSCMLAIFVSIVGFPIVYSRITGL